MEEAVETIKNITEGVKTLGLPIGILALVVVGIAYMAAKDPQKKEMHTSWAMNIAIGLIVVWLADSVMDWVTEQITTYG